MYIPRGMVHGFENPHAETAKALVVITPGVFGAPYFREMAALLAGGGPADPKALVAVMLRHGGITRRWPVCEDSSRPVCEKTRARL